MNKTDMKPGILVRMPDNNASQDPDFVTAAVVGLDPYEEKWVVACPTWTMGISHVEDDDYEHMEIVEPELDVEDQILDERERTGL